MKDYSQHGEQQIIMDYFGDFTGFLLDIGANDGVTFSNSRYLLEQGWYGVLVEPSKKTFNTLTENSKTLSDRVVLHNVAIGTYNGVTEFFESGPLVSKKDHSLVSSMKEPETERWKKRSKPGDPIVKFSKKYVPVITFSELLRNSGCDTFQFINLDVEGMELEILRQMDFNTLGCKLICVEYNGRDYEEYDLLIPMPLIYKNKTNLIYAAKK